MAELTEAERYLVDQIRQGKADGWSQLVTRYQGRLLAFARSRLKRTVEAEDLVQDTFVSFLTGLASFREGYSLETFLFTILRRKIIDHFRGRNSRICFIQDLADGGSDDADMPAAPQIESGDLTASVYGEINESESAERTALAGGLVDLISRLKQAGNFRDLKIVEMLFYAHVRNKDAAKLLAMDEKQIALIKHRCLKEVKEGVAKRLNRSADDLGDWWESNRGAASMLSEVWEEQRLTCPKRTTVGRLMLGTLEEPWKDYVGFHVNTLGCAFCKANLEDLQNETNYQPTAMHDRVMQSTIGFFKQG
jgi:RNA polymerase sigma factor (sigma-70 family)